MKAQETMVSVTMGESSLKDLSPLPLLACDLVEGAGWGGRASQQEQLCSEEPGGRARPAQGRLPAFCYPGLLITYYGHKELGFWSPAGHRDLLENMIFSSVKWRS